MNQGSRTITAAKGSIGNLGLKECDGGRGGSLRTERRFAEAMAKGREKVAGKGEHVLQGMVRYQACDARSCLPPRTLVVAVPFTAR